MGGIIVDRRQFPWRHAKRFRQFNQPDPSYHGLVYVDRFGEAACIARARSVYQRNTGAVLAPLSAFLLLQGIETVALRSSATSRMRGSPNSCRDRRVDG